MILLVRHAWAGERSEWEGDDRRRPLDERGRRQAEELVELLAPYELSRIVSSPYDRCVQTVEPLAAARGLEIEPNESLAEERQEEEGAALVRSLAANTVVSCHGGLSESVCRLHLKKGEALLLDRAAGQLRVVGRLRPPS